MELMTTRSERPNHSYVASEENFKMLREFERNNLLVRSSGISAATKPSRRWAGISEHGATATSSTRRTSSSICFRTKLAALLQDVTTLPSTTTARYPRVFTWVPVPAGHHHARSTFLQLLDPFKAC